MLDAGQLRNERSPSDALIFPLIEMLNKKSVPLKNRIPFCPCSVPHLSSPHTNLFRIVHILTGGFFSRLEDMK